MRVLSTEAERQRHRKGIVKEVFRLRHVHLRLLGPFELVVSDGDVLLTAKKSQALLCFLALHPDQPVSRKKLATLLWTDTAEEFARANLRQCVAVVRKALKNDRWDCIVSQGSSILLDSRSTFTDVQEFENLVEVATPEALESALTLYRGNLLEGVNLDDCSFTDWLRIERLRRQEAFSLLCHQLLAHYRQCGDAEAERKTAARLLAHDSVDETAHRSLMYCHAALGRRNLAIRQYKTCVQLLRKELDASPEKATQDLYENILKLNSATIVSSDSNSLTSEISPHIQRPDTAQSFSGGTRTSPSRTRWILLVPILVLVLGLSIYARKHSESDKTNTAVRSVLENAGKATNAVQPTIAVLPFTNISDDADQEYFSDGLTEDLITDISSIAGLNVIARSSSFSYRSANPDFAQISNELGASFVLLGSTRKMGNRIRINVQLINTTDGTQLWADRYDRKLSDVLVVQDEISRTIVNQLSARITDSEQRRLDRVLQVNPDAYDLLLKSLRPIRELTRTGTVEARRILEQVVELDSRFARGWANLALTYSLDLNMGFTENREETKRLGFKYASIAEKLDSTLPQLHFALSGLHLGDRSFDKALKSAIRSIEIDPNYADGYGNLAQVLLFTGELDSAAMALDKAKRLNPRFTFTYLWLDGQILFLSKRYSEAADVFTAINDRNPSFVSSRLMLISTYGHLNRQDDAEWEIAELLTARPDFSLVNERENAKYQSSEDIQLYVDGLVRAGL